MNYIVIDLEFNQSFKFENGTKTDPVAECPFEIIQIGAVKLDSRFNIIQTADFLIRPKIYTLLHPYVKKLTDLNIEKLAKKPYFPEVYADFMKFIDCGENGFMLCTWGSADVAALIRNAAYYKLDTSKLTGKYINVQEMAARSLNRPRGMNIGLSSAVTEFGLEAHMNFHYALNDALYTAKIFALIGNIDEDSKVI